MAGSASHDQLPRLVNGAFEIRSPFGQRELRGHLRNDAKPGPAHFVKDNARPVKRIAVPKLDRACIGQVLAREMTRQASRLRSHEDRIGAACDQPHNLIGNGVRTIIVETANRFARDLIVQETGYAMLKGHGIELIAADSPAGFLDDTPTATLIRQILGAVSQFEKAMVVSKLKGARDRKRATGVRVEGRIPYIEAKPDPGQELHRYPVNRRRLRDIATALAAAGYVATGGKPYSASAVSRMLEM